MDFNYKRAIKKIIGEELKANNPDILSFFHLEPLYEKKNFLAFLTKYFLIIALILEVLSDF